MSTRLVDLLPRRTVPPLWRELRAVRELREVASHPVMRGGGLPCGDGGPVLLVPGLMAGDASLRPMAACLTAAGHAPVHAGITCNIDCSEATAAALTARLERTSDAHGCKVAIVGHSRGGLFARALAQRRPELVSGIVTLGTPWRDQLAIHPLLWAELMALASMRVLGVRRILGHGCGIGGCCARFRRDVEAAPPHGVRYVSVYSRADGVVDWRACPDDRAENVEVAVSHCGMAASIATCHAVAEALANLRTRPRRPLLMAA
jgi:triacylglycerol lipase